MPANSISSDRCSKTNNISSPKFFALSAYSFKTEVQEQLDGYTILWLPDQTQVLQTIESAEDAEKQKLKPAEKHGNDFVLFKTCQNSLYWLRRACYRHNVLRSIMQPTRGCLWVDVQKTNVWGFCAFARERLKAWNFTLKKAQSCLVFKISPDIRCQISRYSSNVIPGHTLLVVRGLHSAGQAGLSRSRAWDDGGLSGKMSRVRGVWFDL